MNKYEKAISIVDIINSEEFEDKSVSFYLDSEIADIVTDILLDQIDLCEDYTEGDIIDIIDNNEIVSVIVIRDIRSDYMYTESVFTKNGVQILDENDVFFIQDEWLDVVDLDKLHGEIAVLYCEHDEESEENDLEFIDDVMEDLLYEIGNPKDGECSHDILKRYLVDMYETGRLDMLNEIIEDIDG